jgi:Holliday junction resolvase RusA-like endonuclease
MITFTIPLAAKPQGSKKAFVINGKAVLVEASKDLKALRAEFSRQITEQAYLDKWVRIDRPDPALVTIVFTFVRPSSVKREHMTVVPDLDKLTRFCLDALTQADNIWEDDSQATAIHAYKTYGPEAKTEITVSRV